MTTNFGIGAFRGGVTVQADGKVVASALGSAPGARFGLVRYTVDGTIDPTFGGGTRVYEFRRTGGASPVRCRDPGRR